jgi:Co/Zn/Cd efflux system component
MADPIITIFIVILIVKMGIEIIRGSSDILLDKAPLDEQTSRRL